MAHLIIDHNTMLFKDDGTDRQKSLQNFIEAGLHARKNKDILYGSEVFSNFKYGWGNFFSDLAYKSYSEIRNIKGWEWLSQSLHQILQNFFFQNPSGGSDFTDINHFFDVFKNENYGTIGCECVAVITTDVTDIPSWHKWKIKYYQLNPDKYQWRFDDHVFLPNKFYSDKILEREVINHNEYDKIGKIGLALAFHDAVMKLKGPELRAFAVSIGNEIAESNYYIFEEDLSKDEQNASSGSPRKIFSFIDESGKKMYLSIDHAHGMFELHDHSGAHKGEYKFDGSYNSGPDPTHDLKTL